MSTIGVALAYLYPELRPNDDYLVGLDGWKWLHASTPPTTQEISAAVLPAMKAARIAQINDECRARILVLWPLEKQCSALAGIYGSAERAAMTDFIDAHIAASDVATSAVFDATTQAAMEAVTVTWPV